MHRLLVCKPQNLCSSFPVIRGETAAPGYFLSSFLKRGTNLQFPQARPLLRVIVHQDGDQESRSRDHSYEVANGTTPCTSNLCPDSQLFTLRIEAKKIEGIKSELRRVCAPVLRRDREPEITSLRIMINKSKKHWLTSPCLTGACSYPWLASVTVIHLIRKVRSTSMARICITIMAQQKNTSENPIACASR